MAYAWAHITTRETMGMSKTTKVLLHLKAGKTLTGKQAWDKFGLYRLSSVIENLRNKGYPITCEMCKAPNGDKYGKYRYVEG